MSASEDLRRDRLVRPGQTSVTVSFRDEVIAAIDHLAARYDMSRTEVVRSLVVSRLEYGLGWSSATHEVLHKTLSPPPVEHPGPSSGEGA